MVAHGKDPVIAVIEPVVEQELRIPAVVGAVVGRLVLPVAEGLRGHHRIVGGLHHVHDHILDRVVGLRAEQRTPGARGDPVAVGHGQRNHLVSVRVRTGGLSVALRTGLECQ